MTQAQLMIIDDFHVGRTCWSPTKTKAELIIDTNAMLAFAIALECLQPVSTRYARVIEDGGTIQHGKLTHCHGFELDETLDTAAVKQTFRFSAREGDNGHDQ